MERDAPRTAWIKMIQPRVLGLRVGFSKLGTECSKDGLGLQVPATGKKVPYFLRQVVTSERDHWNLRAVSRIRKGSSHWC